MITLNDSIEVSSSGFVAPISGLYNYSLYKGSSIIFVGQVYLNQGDDEVFIDVTDILKNYTYDAPRLYNFENIGAGVQNIVEDHINTVHMAITIGNVGHAGPNITVGFFYTHPVYENLYPTTGWDLPSTDTSTYPLQSGVIRGTGSNWKNTNMFISHYPFVNSNIYGPSILLNAGNAGSLTFTWGGRTSGNAVVKSVTQNRLNAMYYSLASLFTSVVDDPTQPGKYGSLMMYGEELAKIDMCPCRYYLKWQDRYGSWCSFGFDGKSLYQESIEKEETMNWKNVTSHTSSTVKSTWSLNSTWIPESDVKHFEDIYVSPYLALYDVELNKVHQVIIRDTEYEERNYENNGKKLISLSFTLELAKQQLILS